MSPMLYIMCLFFCSVHIVSFCRIEYLDIIIHSPRAVDVVTAVIVLPSSGEGGVLLSTVLDSEGLAVLPAVLDGEGVVLLSTDGEGVVLLSTVLDG